MFGYQIEIEADDNGTFLVTCPALPEVTTFGATDEEIERAALAAIEEAIAARIDRDADIAPPVRMENAKGRFVKLPALTALKIQLVFALRENGITRAELQRRLDWHREQVDRLFRLDHASRLDRMEAAFEALHREVDIIARVAP
jgi:antitoxin HicB